MSAEWISAFAASVSAVTAVALTGIALVQLSGLREQIKDALETEQRRNSLDACQRLEKDPELKESMKHIWNRSNGGTDYTKLDSSDQFYVLTVLNYFDGISCGIEQGIIIEELAKDYLRYPLIKAVRAFIEGESGDSWKAERRLITEDGFDSLMRVYEAWKQNLPAYHIRKSQRKRASYSIKQVMK